MSGVGPAGSFKLLQRAKIHQQGEAGFSIAIGRDSVRLSIVLPFQTGFDIARKTIGLSEKTRIVSREQFVLGKLFESRQGVRALKKGLATRVKELESLSDEFDLANATTPQLNIAVEFIGFDDFVFDAIFHR